MVPATLFPILTHLSFHMYLNQFCEESTIPNYLMLKHFAGRHSHYYLYDITVFALVRGCSRIYFVFSIRLTLMRKY